MKSSLKKIIISFAVACVLTALAASNVLYALNESLSDKMYQKTRAVEGDILLINIDQAALDELGDFSYWGRALMGDIISILNSDPDNLPAVIALDVLYVGGSDDPDGDTYLAECVSDSVPVVVAAAATMETRVIENEDGGFYVDDYCIAAMDEPYDELKEVAEVGIINSMFDADGVLRHGIYQMDYNGSTIPSMHKVIYEKYCEYKGVEPTTVPSMDIYNRYYVPFAQTPGGMSDGMSVLDLLYGEIDPSEWAGKIVMIGPYAAGMQDDFTTAISNSEKMYGVEYQANMVQALIDGVTKREAKALPQYIAIFLICFGMMILFLNQKLWVNIISWIAVSGGYIGVCFFLASKGVLLMPLYIPIFVSLEFIASVAVHYIKAAREKAAVKATFQRYVAPEIVGELLKGDPEALELGGKMVDVAVLFVDIRGFTTMSESLHPTEVVSIINKYLTLTSDCIFKNGGTLDKFVGDCTMAFWGAPLPQEDIIFKALSAAFDMVEGSKKLKIQLEEEYGRSVDFGVGVHFGPAVIGNIGSVNRMDYTAIGDTVNTASRLESNAPAGTVYVSRVVADALEGRANFESLGGAIKLKGKAEGFEVLIATPLQD